MAAEPMSLDVAWSAVEAALIAAQGDDDGFSVDIGYWDEFQEEPWAVRANDISLHGATLPAALLALAEALTEA